MELVIMLSGLVGVQSLRRRVKTTRCCGSTKTRRRADTYDDRRVNSASD